MSKSLPLIAMVMLAWQGCDRDQAPRIDPGAPPEVTVEPLPSEPRAPPARMAQVSAPVALAPVARVPPPLGATVTATVTPEGATRLAEVTAIQVEVTLEGAAEPGELGLLIATPEGHSYQFARWGVEGDPFARQQASLEVLVAGTAAQSLDLAGSWSITVHHAGLELARAELELAHGVGP